MLTKIWYASKIREIWVALEHLKYSERFEHLKCLKCLKHSEKPQTIWAKPPYWLQMENKYSCSSDNSPKSSSGLEIPEDSAQTWMQFEVQSLWKLHLSFTLHSPNRSVGLDKWALERLTESLERLGEPEEL